LDQLNRSGRAARSQRGRRVTRARTAREPQSALRSRAPHAYTNRPAILPTKRLIVNFAGGPKALDGGRAPAALRRPRPGAESLTPGCVVHVAARQHRACRPRLRDASSSRRPDASRTGACDSRNSAGASVPSALWSTNLRSASVRCGATNTGGRVVALDSACTWRLASKKVRDGLYRTVWRAT